MNVLHDIAEDLLAALRHKVDGKAESLSYQVVSGGSINAVYKLTVEQKQLCCKINSVSDFPGMFSLEADGLALLRSSGAIRVPEVIVNTVIKSSQVLVLEWLEPQKKTPGFWKTFAEQLSQLHCVKGTSFGLDYDNYMGALKQTNKRSALWTDFFFEQRIQPQVRLAADNGLLSASQCSLFERLPTLLPQLFPQAAPVLLHGDLWSGNFICTDRQQPALIDPAVYYGHSAVDLALTTLFGGFDKSFYEAYHYYNPLPADHDRQWDCCNLYPLLIHLNLFGRSYLPQIISIIKGLQ